jgi:flotillin
VAEDLAKMGLEVISFTLKQVRDRNEYIEAMGKPDVARIKRDADMATAEASRDTAIRQATTQRESAVARALADQERVLAETLSQAKQAEAQKDLAVKRAQFEALAKREQAQADKSYEIQTNIMLQQVVTEEVSVQRVRKEGEIKVQEAEILRREKELSATVLKDAEYSRKRIETLAEAERQRLTLEATGRADAQKVEGGAAAEVIRVKGTAEADIIRAKGASEAGAMQLKADAFRQYNEAAVLDKVLTGFPDIVRALGEPLSKVDRITVVSTGAEGSTGVHKLTADMAQVVAQVPALLEALTGKKVSELMSRLPALGAGAPPSEPGKPAAEAEKPSRRA